MHTVGHRGDGDIRGVEPWPELPEHPTTDLTVQLRHPVRALAEPQSHHRHVESAGRTALVVLGAEREHVVGGHGRQQLGREVLGDERRLEAVDPRGDGRMGGEHRPGAHDLKRFPEGQSDGDQVVDPFQPEEARMPLVGVEHLGRRGVGELGEELEGADAADAQQQLLQQAMLSPAAVETVGDRSEVVVVLGDVGVEQEQLDAPDRHLPDTGVEDAAAGQRECDVRGGTVRVAQHAQRQAVGVQHRIGLLLPAVRRDRLGEVSGPVEQADADDGHAEVRCALEMVPGQDAETSGVLGQCRSDPELRREVADRPWRARRQGLVPARFVQVGMEVAEHLVDATDVVAVAGEFIQSRRLDLAQQSDRIVSALLPQRG